MGYHECLPYDVPFDGCENAARVNHREFYWFLHDKADYNCPDCGRGIGDVQRFEVHHLDRDPLNGHLWNLLALCKRCHRWRHESPTVSGYSLDEWKEAFVDPAFQPTHSD